MYSLKYRVKVFSTQIDKIFLITENNLFQSVSLVLKCFRNKKMFCNNVINFFHWVGFELICTTLLTVTLKFVINIIITTSCVDKKGVNEANFL